MISTIVSRLVILVFGTLYPAYASYKAVRTKNVKEYVKWMMYWIVFALFTCAETFTDVFLSWFPFYYEIKIILVLWLLSPATKGSSILYRKFVHPMLSRREQEIDEYISKAKEQGYHTVLNLGTKGVNYATTVIMQTAIKGGGGIVNQLRKSYSLSDLTHDTDARADARGLQENADEAGDVIDARLVRRRHSPRRSASGSSRVEMYFPEVDVRPGPLSHVRSTEDVSSGYSSAEPLYVGQPLKLEPREALGLVRTASVGGSSRPRIRSTRASVATKKAVLPEDSECSEESETDSEPSTSTVRYIPKKSLHTSATNGETESSENSEFEDTIGFPAEQKPIKIKTVEASQPPVQQIVETVCDIQIIEIAQPQIVENVCEVIEVAQIEKIKGDIIEIKNDVKVAQIERVDQVEDNIETVCNVKLQVKESSLDIFEDSIQETIEEIIKDSEDTVTIKDSKEELLVLSDKVESNNIVDSIYEDVELHLKSEEQNVVEDNYETISLCSVSQRGGKYNKHAAPIPPSQMEKLTTSTEEIESNINLKDTCSKTLTSIEDIDTLETKVEVFDALEPEFEDASSEILKMDHSSGDPKRNDDDSNSHVPSDELNLHVQVVSETLNIQIPKITSDESINISETISIDTQKEEANSSSKTTINQNQSSEQLLITDEQKLPSKKIVTTSLEKLNKLEEELDKSEPESLPIKATLILKPGVIKSLGSSEDSNKTEVFVSHSSKPKQKSKSKHESPISRLMMLPKKIFGYKEHEHSSNENLNAEKRKSWHDDSHSSTPVSNYSKSDSDGSREQLNKDNQKEHDSKLVLRTLSHSPKQYRRKSREVERYEDSD